MLFILVAPSIARRASLFVYLYSHCVSGFEGAELYTRKLEWCFYYPEPGALCFFHVVVAILIRKMAFWYSWLQSPSHTVTRGGGPSCPPPPPHKCANNNSDKTFRPKSCLFCMYILKMITTIHLQNINFKITYILILN